jgi:hypothetical protein
VELTSTGVRDVLGVQKKASAPKARPLRARFGAALRFR